MSTIPKPEKIQLTAETKASSYDKLSALLVALVSVIGFLVFIMFLIWLTMTIEFQPATQSTILEPAGNEDRPKGIADDWQEPGVEEFPEVEQPQLSDALEAVTDAVSTIKGRLEQYDGTAPEMGRGRGLGDMRQAGSGTGNSPIIPESKRWEIEYVAGNMAEYLTILENFDITLGAVSQTSNQIHYVDDLTAATPRTNTGLRRDEPRLYFMNTKNRMRRWDSNKIASTGVDMRNKLVVQFYDEPVRQTLRNLEREVYERAGRTLIEVNKTFFRVQPVGGGYEYYVEEIQYRTAPK